MVVVPTATEVTLTYEDIAVDRTAQNLTMLGAIGLVVLSRRGRRSLVPARKPEDDVEQGGPEGEGDVPLGRALTGARRPSALGAFRRLDQRLVSALAPTPTQLRLPGMIPSRFQPVEAWRALVERVGYPRLLLALAMIVWGWIFAVHVYYRHIRFGTFDFDLGIYDQLMWLFSHGEGFLTVRGLPAFGHHLNFGMLLFVPFYWLGAGPNFLNIVMVAALMLGAVPVFLAAQHHLKSQWLALPVAVAFLLHFSNQWLLWETFHPDVLAMTPMLFAYLYALRERWLPFALWLTLAVSWKEDVAGGSIP
jgi:hypothetical protein